MDFSLERAAAERQRASAEPEDIQAAEETLGVIKNLEAVTATITQHWEEYCCEILEGYISEYVEMTPKQILRDFILTIGENNND